METQDTAVATSWTIDPTHSEVQFKIKHLVISTVTGSFNKFEGELKSDDGDFDGGEVLFNIDVNSIDTNVEDRDNHLRSKDFFSVEKFPNIKFGKGKLKKLSEGKFKLVGPLTIKDVTKEVELDVEHGGVMEDPYGNTKAGFEVTGSINRKEFGLTWSQVTEAGGVVVGDTVKLMMSIQLVKN